MRLGGHGLSASATKYKDNQQISSQNDDTIPIWANGNTASSINVMNKKEIEHIIKNNLISTCNEQEKKEVFDYAFGKKFMASNDKGRLKEEIEKEVQAWIKSKH